MHFVQQSHVASLVFFLVYSRNAPNDESPLYSYDAIFCIISLFNGKEEQQRTDKQASTPSVTISQFVPFRLL